jgi:hypothetical protein
MRRFAGTNQRASERGTVLLLATITILVVVAMLALAVDIGYLMNGRGQMQNVVDSAALAAAQGMRLAIEPAGSRIHQDTLVRKLAKDFALYNPVRRADGAYGLSLPDSDILIEYPANYPVQQARVIVKNRTALPTIFGNVFGISSMNVSAVAISSTAVVDGGTGMVSGCWRPILIPDSFYDQNRNVWAISGKASFSDNSFSPHREGPNGEDLSYAQQTGDYYISRYASANPSSDRNANRHFLQQWPPGSGVPTGEATSIRDAYDLNELKYVNGVVTGRNLIGQRIKFRRDDWRIVDFAKTGITGNFPADPVQQINKGCCTPIQVGTLVQVYEPTNPANTGIYDNFILELKNFRDLLATSDLQSLSAQQYRYIQSQRYPTPNASPRVLPVLLCSPIEFSNSRAINQFYVTNVGAFFLESVSSEGDITGFFVREVVTGGMPLQAQHAVTNSGLLPISVNLVR